MKNTEDKNYTVYMHVNKFNNKVYIGITGRSVEERWANGNGYYRNKHFYNSIQKYGWNEGFEHIILAEGLSLEDAYQMEVELIKKYNSTDKTKGYNNDNGGKNAERLTEETKRKISESHKGIYPTKETREKLSLVKSGKNNPMYGRKLSEEHKQLLIMHNKGRKKSIEEIEKFIESRGHRTFRYDLDGKFIDCFKSAREAARETKSPVHSVKQCCLHNYHSAGGFIFRYEKDGYAYGENLPKKELSKPKNYRSVDQFSLDGEYIATYENCTAAGKAIGHNFKSINDCCHGRQKTAYGYMWKFSNNQTN